MGFKITIGGISILNLGDSLLMKEWEGLAADVLMLVITAHHHKPRYGRLGLYLMVRLSANRPGSGSYTREKLAKVLLEAGDHDGVTGVEDYLFAINGDFA